MYHKGLGDTIEAITRLTGVKAVVGEISKIANIPCGCEKRREQLNKLFPYEKSN